MKIHSSTGTLFSYHFCILLPSHEWHWGFCRQFSLFFVVIFFLNCTFRILAYVNILTTNIFCSPRSPSDAVWVWEELGTSCEGCRHRMSALCLSCLDPTAASYPATVESHPSRPPFLQASSVLFPLGINASSASLSKNDFSRFLQSHADSDFDLTSTQHVSDIQRYGVLFLFSGRWGQHEGKPFRLNRVDLKCT